MQINRLPPHFHTCLMMLMPATLQELQQKSPETANVPQRRICIQDYDRILQAYVANKLIPSWVSFEMERDYLAHHVEAPLLDPNSRYR